MYTSMHRGSHWLPCTVWSATKTDSQVCCVESVTGRRSDKVIVPGSIYRIHADRPGRSRVGMEYGPVAYPRMWIGGLDSFPSSLFSSPSFFTPSLPLPFLSFFLFSLRSRTPKIQLWDLVKRCELFQRGPFQTNLVHYDNIYLLTQCGG